MWSANQDQSWERGCWPKAQVEPRQPERLLWWLQQQTAQQGFALWRSAQEPQQEGRQRVFAEGWHYPCAGMQVAVPHSGGGRSGLRLGQKPVQAHRRSAEAQ